MDKYTPYCQRCRKDTSVLTMSWFNTQLICMECSDKEEAHPRIKEAKDAERAELQKGNRNYIGIGLPNDLR